MRLQLIPSAPILLKGVAGIALVGVVGGVLLPTTDGTAAPPASPQAAVKYSRYWESRDRVDVLSPLVWFLAPVGEKYSVELSGTVDSLSGATPQIDGISSATMSEHRKAADIKITRYFNEFDLAISGATSSEHDYHSTAFGADSRWYFNQKNTILGLGFNYSSDRITSTNDSEFREDAESRDFLIGITQELSTTDIIQSNLTYGHDSGYLSDPYKFALVSRQITQDLVIPTISDDTRPDERDRFAWLTRYNHHFPGLKASSHLDYRFFWDDWGVAAHTIDLEWYQQVGDNWMVRPAVRYYSQDQADFYVTDSSEMLDDYNSADYRLANFGALTLGLKIGRRINDYFSVDLKGEYYVQDNGLHLGGNGNSDDPVEAATMMLGLNINF